MRVSTQQNQQPQQTHYSGYTPPSQPRSTDPYNGYGQQLYDPQSGSRQQVQQTRDQENHMNHKSFIYRHRRSLIFWSLVGASLLTLGSGISGVPLIALICYSVYLIIRRQNEIEAQEACCFSRMSPAQQLVYLAQGLVELETMRNEIIMDDDDLY